MTTPTEILNIVLFGHAADLLESFARDLREGSNPPQEWNNPQWLHEENSKREYDDLVSTAKALQELVKQHPISIKK